MYDIITMSGGLILVMDASVPLVQVGLLSCGEWVSFYKTGGEVPLKGLYGGVQRCLEESGKSLKDVDEMVYCRGPGSMLGIRLVAMGIRTWRALPEMKDVVTSAYDSLAMGEELMRLNGECGKDGAVIMESRRGYWFCKKYGENGIEEMSKESVMRLEGEVLRLGHRKVWEGKLEGVEYLNYDIEGAASVFEKTGFLDEVGGCGGCGF